MRRVVFALIVLGAASSSSAQAPSNRFAVIIDAEPSMEELRGSPGTPLGSMADALRASGYAVDSLEKALRYETLRRVYQLASELSEQDTVVVYFSGYVVRRPEAQGGVHWLQTGGSLETLETDGARLAELFDAFRKIPSRRKLLLLDFVFLGDAAATFESDAKMQMQVPMQKQSRFSPPVALTPGSLPLAEIGEELGFNHLALIVSREAASRLGSRGLLGALVRDAIAGKADVNGDGVLRSTEVVEFVRRSVAEASLLPEEFQLATKLLDDAPLSVAGRSVARARRERYLALLREWRDRNWISVSTELAARAVLDEWVRSLAQEDPLDPKTQELWNVLQKHIEGGVNDVERARSLEDQFRKRY